MCLLLILTTYNILFIVQSKQKEFVHMKDSFYAEYSSKLIEKEQALKLMREGDRIMCHGGAYSFMALLDELRSDLRAQTRKDLAAELREQGIESVRKD